MSFFLLFVGFISSFSYFHIFLIYGQTFWSRRWDVSIFGELQLEVESWRRGEKRREKRREKRKEELFLLGSPQLHSPSIFAYLDLNLLC